MVSKQSRSEIRRKKHYRLRNRFAGTAERPRLAVFRSNKMCIRDRNKRRGMIVGKTAKTKKAIVKLTADSKEIEIFQGL